MAKNVYGLDLGSYEIKVYDKKSDTIWKEKNVIAIKEDREIFAEPVNAKQTILSGIIQNPPGQIQCIFTVTAGTQKHS